MIQKNTTKKIHNLKENVFPENFLVKSKNFSKKDNYSSIYHGRISTSTIRIGKKIDYIEIFKAEKVNFNKNATSTNIYETEKNKKEYNKKEKIKKRDIEREVNRELSR